MYHHVDGSMQEFGTFIVQSAPAGAAAALQGQQVYGNPSFVPRGRGRGGGGHHFQQQHHHGHHHHHHGHHHHGHHQHHQQALHGAVGFGVAGPQPGATAVYGGWGAQPTVAAVAVAPLLSGQVLADDAYEVHDNQLKAPVSIRRSEVVPTVGSHRMFSHPPQPMNPPQAGAAPRNAPRICEPFQHGQCLHGEECPDIHVAVEVMQSMRTSMMSWLMSKENEFNETALHAPETTFRVFAADLKEVVDVPIGALSFTRGLYVDPSARAKRSRYGQQSAFALMAAQVPTACGLHSVDPQQCKWGRWCNQAHIDPYWMRMKRGEFEHWSRSLEQQFEDMPDENVFVVHDPQTKTSLQIPKIAVAGFSRGLFQGNAKKAPSVCMLFQRGRCTAGSCCNQIHIVPEYLGLMRQYVSDGNPELVGLMQQVALRQKQLALLHNAQIVVVTDAPLLDAQTLGLNSAQAQRVLNPGAKAFIPVGEHPNTSGASAVAMPATSTDVGLSTAAAGAPPSPLINFAPFTQARPSSATPTTQSPVLRPAVGPGTPQYAGNGTASPKSRSGLLSDLRTEEDEIYEKRRNSGSTSAATPLKQNNPYQLMGQKPIGVPPSPLTSAMQGPSTATQHPGGSITSFPQGSFSSVPQTPPIQFGWVPQARAVPAMASLPPPPSPYRSAALKTPTSPQYPPAFTPDLTHVQFSPSPLLRGQDSITQIPKNMSLDAFDDFHLQQSLSHTQQQQQHQYHQQQQSQQHGPFAHHPSATTLSNHSISSASQGRASSSGHTH